MKNKELGRGEAEGGTIEKKVMGSKKRKGIERRK